MIKQLSNSNSLKSKILIIVIFAILLTGSLLFQNLFKTKMYQPLILAILFIIIYYLFVARFSTVHIDDNQLYYRGLLKKGIIPFKRLISVNTEFFSVNQSFGKSFPIVVRYRNNKGKIRKVTFLSNEIGRLDEPEKVYAIKLLREIIELHKNQ